MSTIPSNVYYLPVPAVDEPVVIERGAWTAFTARLGNAWWRVRLTLAELRAALRRARRRARTPEAAAFFEGFAEVRESPRVQPLSPARVIDFGAARLRLRPVLSAQA